VSDAVALFGDEAVQRGRRYHRPLYVAALADAALTLALLVVLVATPAGAALRRPVDGLPWWLEVPAFTAIVLAVAAVIRLPLALWRGWWRERRWELSTQSLGAYLADRAKGYAVGAVLTGVALTLLAALVRLFPDAWPIVGAVGAALLVLLLGFVAPVVLEPLFNRFRPLEGPLAARLHGLASLAGTPVDAVLVADASRRTRKLNAYVSGVGRTRRIVVYDTLLDAAEPDEVAATVAHELGHRRHGHVARLTVAGMVGAAASVGAVWLLLGDEAGDASRVPAILLVLLLCELVGGPLFAALSRRYERAADRAMVELSGDARACEAAFRRLAGANVADLDPPRAVRLLLASHPPLPERIAAVRSATVRR
jgi:STE24 endopeptidase